MNLFEKYFRSVARKANDELANDELVDIRPVLRHESMLVTELYMDGSTVLFRMGPASGNASPMKRMIGYRDSVTAESSKGTQIVEAIRISIKDKKQTVKK